MMRVVALFVCSFLLFSTVEAWAWVWLAGRWYFSSRYATLTLGKVKEWRDRGIISRTTQQVKIFINKHGKWLLLTLALSEVLRELEDIETSSQFCHVSAGSISMVWTSWGRLIVYASGNVPENFYDVQYGRPCYSGSASVPAIRVYKWVPYRGSYVWADYATVPKAGTYDVGQCQVVITNRNIGGVCDFSRAPSVPDLNQERRRVPVRVFPRVEDFVRPDVIENDPSLRYLRDEYHRISQDSSIPLIPSDVLSGVELPSIGWFIPSEEALDYQAEESVPRPSVAGRDGSVERSENRSEDLPVVPVFDVSLPAVEKRPFPMELVNRVVQSHPLLRVLQDVSLDVGGGGSCVLGSRPFEFNFCPYEWVLNLMGGLLVFISFLTGLFWVGRSE